jgi:Pentapeptide repeats (8 copies)
MGLRLDCYGFATRTANSKTRNIRRLSDLRGADVQSASLSGSNLGYADLRNANLTGTNLIGADLSGVSNLTQPQDDSSLGNKYTRLPPGIAMPKAWALH